MKCTSLLETELLTHAVQSTGNAKLLRVGQSAALAITVMNHSIMSGDHSTIFGDVFLRHGPLQLFQAEHLGPHGVLVAPECVGHQTGHVQVEQQRAARVHAGRGRRVQLCGYFGHLDVVVNTSLVRFLYRVV